MTAFHHIILISACLIGERVRYDGGIRKQIDVDVRRWQSKKRLISLCPEVSGGLPVPRPPAEIQKGVGCDVLCGNSDIVDEENRIVTAAFVKGAKKAMELVRKYRIRVAVLKDGSSSCGVTYIYDGSFSNQRIPGSGVTTALLQENGVRVFSENEITLVDTFLSQLGR
jgi:uncharacterized protein YbbK (DUF523 family)